MQTGNDIRSILRAAALLGAGVMLVTAVGVFAPSAAGALTITVTTTDDGGPGSLRQAIDDINADGPGPHTINLASGSLYQLTECGIGDNGGLQADVGPLTINGNGSTIEQTCTDGRILRFNSEEALTLNQVTITGGNRHGNAGGVKSFGPVTVNDSTFVDNIAEDSGGGLWTENQAVVINNSTFVDNHADSDSNDLGYGGGLNSGNAGATVTNSTFTGNSAAAGGAITAIGQTLRYDTIVGNSATDLGGAIDSEGYTAVGTVIAGNGTASCNGSGSSDGYNWTDDDTCTFTDPTDTIDAGGNPGLGALADNGGFTETLLPADSSPLVDAIPAGACATIGIVEDQRALPRPGGDACDIGSVELQPTPPTVPTTAAPTTTTTPGSRAAAAVVTPRFTG